MNISLNAACALVFVALALCRMGVAPRILLKAAVVEARGGPVLIEGPGTTALGNGIRLSREPAGLAGRSPLLPPFDETRVRPELAGERESARLAVGTIRGRVELHLTGADPTPRATVADVGMGAMHAPPDRRSVIYLDPAPRAAFDARDEPRARLDQQNETFVPHVLAIVAGTTVEFPNNDQTYHNVFSLSKTKSFDLGRYAVGRSKSVRFDRPGIVRVFCDIHSHMSAFILVFSHRYFSVVDTEGGYRIGNVPPGTYEVVAWNESASLETRRVVVPESGGEVELNVALGRR